jgi:hypothetical protein
MSKFAPLQEQLEHYYALAFHQNSDIAQRLADVQAWQKQRMQFTHADFFAVPEHQLMSQYFLNRLYGGPDFDILAHQISRIIKHAGIVEKIMPASAIRTGFAGVGLAVLAIRLDEEIAIDVLENHGLEQPLNDEIMRLSYLKLDQAEARYRQMDLLDELSIALDKYVRSAIVKSAFKMSKGMAYKYKIDPLYEFIDEGFVAMKPLASAQEFVKIFTTEERAIIEKVHAGDAQPFAKAVIATV